LGHTLIEPEINQQTAEDDEDENAYSYDMLALTSSHINSPVSV
jgi:hypothetical protein